METNWLNEREDRAWRGFHRMRTSVMSQIERQLNQDSGLSAAEYEVLVNVSEAPDQRIRSRDLGRALGWERSRLSHQLSRMVRRGTVERAECATDGRGFDVVLTDAGREAIESAAPGHLASVRHCFTDLLTPQQMDALAAISDVVHAHMIEEHDCDT